MVLARRGLAADLPSSPLCLLPVARLLSVAACCLLLPAACCLPQHPATACCNSRTVVSQQPYYLPSLFLFACSYSFYSHLVSCRMLPLRRMVRWTKHIRERLGMAHDRWVSLCGSNVPW